MTSIMSWSERVPRNPHRVRRVSGRRRTSAVESMTPQGQALWASRNIGNAFMFIGPEEKPRDYKVKADHPAQISIDEVNDLLKDFLE